MLEPIYRATDVIYDITLTAQGSAPDLRNDSITWYMFSLSAPQTAVLSKPADVTNDGLNGVATVTLTASDTSLAAGRYLVEVVWQTQAGQTYLLLQEFVEIVERLSV